MLENKNLSTRDRLVPYTMFIDPQLGRIGMNEKEAAERKIKFKTARLPMEHADIRACVMPLSRVVWIQPEV